MSRKYITNTISSPKGNNEKLVHFYELLMEMTKRELTSRYKKTIFGFLWVVVNPVLQMLVIGFIFRFFIKVPIPNYYLYLLIGLLIWNFFSLSVTKTTPSMINERSLIKKANFRHEIIPLSIILSNLVNVSIAFLILAIPLLVIGTLSVVNLVNLFFGYLILIAFTIGFCLLTSALNVRYRDINFFVQALLVVWFYATPIVYSISSIPINLIWLWRLNPLTSTIQLFQKALVDAPGPGWGMLASNILTTLIIDFLGVKIFLSESKNFDDWI